MNCTNVSEAQEHQRKLREQEEELEMLRKEYQRLLKVEEEALKQPGAVRVSVHHSTCMDQNIDNYVHMRIVSQVSTHGRLEFAGTMEWALIWRSYMYFYVYMYVYTCEPWDNQQVWR